jgi:hypothetical protein
MVNNVHVRNFHAPITEVGGLIDRLGSRDDAFWPTNRWPRMRFDRPLAVGAIGGHGPIRYFVEAYDPGRSITFRFTSPKGYVGTHSLDVKEVTSGEVQLRHALKMRVAGMTRLSWPLAFRWLHDALVEDAFDCAESHLMSTQVSERALSTWVRIIRYLMSSPGARALAKRRSSVVVPK